MSEPNERKCGGAASPDNDGVRVSTGTLHGNVLPFRVVNERERPVGVKRTRTLGGIP